VAPHLLQLELYTHRRRQGIFLSAQHFPKRPKRPQRPNITPTYPDMPTHRTVTSGSHFQLDSFLRTRITRRVDSLVAQPFFYSANSPNARNALNTPNNPNTITLTASHLVEPCAAPREPCPL